ncbi:hypothetical protein [Bacillus pseudomycoides]|uniref:hypothetical protein n=1 Tax=Bacillus pseudomycoides TaxID=64104 RepID=UPI000BED4982|nr:hypothetical protein [Bacillus pseudomycoides]PED07910.1 hypothetical protein COO19_12305 [Bacillus pseudomycoides]PEI94370.1 hypothetical protein CN686_16310 [Bacillus pseudomycoides]PEK15587.1 hypothetical protein CN693_22305 [Bacillus pseudomycoides]PEM69200.1 hypothetical protein CN619_22005 [Bacillus pseudomycoides]PEO23731.1 hypothetical protein CN542_00620 [Bacillus pseudomycoides]
MQNEEKKNTHNKHEVPVESSKNIIDNNEVKKTVDTFPSEGGEKKYGSRNSKSVSATAAIPKGTQLEYRVKRLMFYMGYYPKVNIDIRTSYEEPSDIITDLDVYGIYVHKDFTLKTLWADCKSGGVKIHDRISWIKGVMNAVQINDVLFIAGRARTSVKQYARKSGIQILDLSVIDKLEHDYEINKDDWRGSWNPSTQYNMTTILSRIAIPTNETYKKIVKFISSDYWVLDNFSKLKKTITALRELSTVSQFPLNEVEMNSVKWAVYELVNLLLLAILNISKELYYFTDAEKKETVLDGLMSGEVSNQKRKEIFDAAFKVAYGMVKSQIPEFTPPVQMPVINLNPPGYSEAFCDLILRVTNNPFNYYDLLRFLDFLFMEYDLQSKKVDDVVLKEMFPNYEKLIIGAKTILHFICTATNIPRSYFQLIN